MGVFNINKKFILLICLIFILAIGSVSATSDITDSVSVNSADNASGMDCDIASLSVASENNSLNIDEDSLYNENVLEAYDKENISTGDSSDYYNDEEYDDEYVPEEVKFELVSKSSFLYKSGGNVKISSNLVYDTAYATIKYQ